MGRAAQATVVKQAEKAGIYGRPHKPLKVVLPGTRNLRAFERAGPAGAGELASGAHDRNWIDNSSDPYGFSVNESVVTNLSEQAPASIDSAAMRVNANMQFARGHKVVAAALIAVAIGAVLGGTLTSAMQNNRTDTSDGTHLIPSIMPQQPSAFSIRKHEGLLPLTAQPPELIGELITQEPQATFEIAEQYLERIEQLRFQNAALHDELDSLGAETSDLSSELLQLESDMTALDSRTRSQEQTRTIYNFVNIASGIGSGDSPGYSPENGNAVQRYVGSEKGVENELYDPENQATEAPLEWDSNGQPIEFVDAFAQPAPTE